MIFQVLGLEDQHRIVYTFISVYVNKNQIRIICAFDSYTLSLKYSVYYTEYFKLKDTVI